MIEEGDPGAARGRDRVVRRARDAAVGLPGEQPDAWIDGGGIPHQGRDGVVTTAIVDEDQFPALVGLRPDGRDRRAQMTGLRSMHRHDDADERTRPAIGHAPPLDARPEHGKVTSGPAVVVGERMAGFRQQMADASAETGQIGVQAIDPVDDVERRRLALIRDEARRVRTVLELDRFRKKKEAEAKRPCDPARSRRHEAEAAIGIARERATDIAAVAVGTGLADPLLAAQHQQIAPALERTAAAPGGHPAGELAVRDTVHPGMHPERVLERDRDVLDEGSLVEGRDPPAVAAELDPMRSAVDQIVRDRPGKADLRRPEAGRGDVVPPFGAGERRPYGSVDEHADHDRATARIVVDRPSPKS